MDNLEKKYKALYDQYRNEIIKNDEREKSARKARWELMMENKRLHDELADLKNDLTKEFKDRFDLKFYPQPSQSTSE